MKDPRAILQMMMRNSNVSNNGMFQNAMNMMNAGNTRGIQQLVENYCHTNGIDLNQAKRQVEQMFGR